MPTPRPSRILAAIALGGAVVGVLDAVDALVAYRLALGFRPIGIYQAVASGVLGPAAFDGGVPAALLGVVFHCFVAFGATTAFVLAASRVPGLVRNAVPAGLAYGVGVWLFMNWVVIPLSRVQPAPFHLGLTINGILAHALLVGLPIALVARRFLGVPQEQTRGPERTAVAA